MKIHKLNLLFIISKARARKDGRAPLYCRITYLEQRKQFAVGLFVISKFWQPKEQMAKVKPPNTDNEFINSQLSLIKTKINQAFLLLQAQEVNFTVEDIYNKYLGKSTVKNVGLLEYYREYLEKLRKLVGVDIKQITWNKFEYIFKDAKSFIKYRTGKKDILLKELDYAFIIEFEFYLKTEKSQRQVTINKALQRFKKVVRAAVINKYIEDFPFHEHKPKKVITKVLFLTTEELTKLENHTFSQVRLERIKDMFVFCCYTGLAFNEMSRLEEKHVLEGFDGNKWIKMNREKTNKEISIPLLKISTSIIEKYNKGEGIRIFPLISNQKFNSYLKEISEIVGIDKNLTHHTARKTFASTVLLYNDVPMEIVSELLGHSKLSTTQEHYGKVVQKKVSEHMQNLAKKLEN